MENVCRICLQESKPLLDLHKEDYDKNEQKKFYEVFCECTSVQLEPNENSMVCGKCRDRLQSAFELKKQAVQSTEYLRNFVTIKVESDIFVPEEYDFEMKLEEDSMDDEELKYENENNQREEKLKVKSDHAPDHEGFQKRSYVRGGKIRERCRFCLKPCKNPAMRNECEQEHLSKIFFS